MAAAPKRHIALRAEGNEKIGLGHLYRLLALGQMLETEYTVHFISDSTRFLEGNLPDSFEAHPLPELALNAEPSWLAANFSPAEHLLILDGYSFDVPYQQACKDQGFTLVYVDDLIRHGYPANLILNPAAGIEASRYELPATTPVLTGPDYALLRPAFLQAAQKPAATQKIQHILISMGGSDPLDLSGAMCEAIRQDPELSTLEISVILGAGYRHRASLPANILRHLNESQMLEAMQQADLAIIPASTTSYEACATGVPMLCGYFVDNQLGIYQGLQDHQAAFAAGDWRQFDPEGFKEALRKMIQLPTATLQEQITKQRTFVDGKSAERIRTALTQLRED